MPIVADAAVAVRGDLSGFKKDIAGAEKQTQTLGQKLKSALTPGNIVAGLGITAGFAGITSIISGATNAAAEFADSLGATGVIFGEEMIPQMEEWGEAAASNFGASKQEALAAANVIATLGKSAGLAGQDLVDFSQEMVTLGGDLASMFGGTTQDAITAVSAALRGESEPIRRYGVLLDDATLRQQAFEMGIISTTKNALTPQQRVLAAQQSILEQTADAQGDFVRTSDGMANTQREIAAELENVNIELGEKMMPVMLAFATWMKNDGIPLLTEFLDLLSMDTGSAEGIPFVGDIEAFLNDAADWGPRLNDGLFGRKDDIIESAKQIGVSYEEMRDQIRTAMSDLGISHEEAIDKVLNDAKVLEQAKSWEAYQNQIRAGGDGIDAAAADMADGIPEAMEGALAEGQEIARQTPGSLANELRAGIEDYDAALEELTEVATNSVSDLAERQKIEGILASKELTDALNSDSTRTRLLAQELVADLVSDYELLAPGALASGKLVNPALRSGMTSNLVIAEQGGRAVRNAAGLPLVDTSWAETGGLNVGTAWALGLRRARYAAAESARILAGEAYQYLHGRSPAKEGPLSQIDIGGRNIGRAWAEGLGAAAPWAAFQSRNLAATAADVLTGAIAPSLAMAGATPIPPQTPVGVGPTYIVNVNGVQRTIKSEEEAMQALRDLGAFSDDGRLG